MKYIHKHKSSIAKITLAAILLILLLALNFRIWNPSYSEGSLVDGVYGNAKIIGQCTPTAEISSLNAHEQIRIEHTAPIDAINNSGEDLLSTIRFLMFLAAGYVLDKTKHTLVSLCLRMNN